MPAFTTISNALVAVGAKPFATTMQALRDNPLAIAEGDPTAPKILDAALDTGAATAEGIAWVGLRMAAAPHGGVGTYLWAGQNGGSTAVAFGSTIAGSSLTPAGLAKDAASAFEQTLGGGVRAGTWRAMGTYPASSGGGAARAATLWLRIA